MSIRLSLWISFCATARNNFCNRTNRRVQKFAFLILKMFQDVASIKTVFCTVGILALIISFTQPISKWLVPLPLTFCSAIMTILITGEGPHSFLICPFKKWRACHSGEWACGSLEKVPHIVSWLFPPSHWNIAIENHDPRIYQQKGWCASPFHS